MTHTGHKEGGISVIYRYIAIEGVIGVGKTSLAKLLAERMEGRLVLEKPEENPFLEDFYRDQNRFAFQTQIFFLLSRYQQQVDFPQQDLFHPVIISDYLFAKDKIFAHINLSEHELLLYDRILELMEPRIPKPDLVIYLQSNTDRLMKNIRIRSRSYEKPMSEEYIRTLNEAYNHFFFHYNDTPLLVVNATRIDFVNNKKDFEDLIDIILRPITGISYYNPESVS
jgi:deoxyguanosine kinase